jgi:hypothetical protein
MADDVSAETRARVVAAIARARSEGCPVTHRPEEIAPIAIQRWSSSTRRGLKPSDRKGRIRDLARGLVAHFDFEPTLVGPLSKDYEYLAECVADALEPGGGG